VPELRLGPFAVQTERTRIAAYRSATRVRGTGIPVAFPICWFGRSEIRTAIEDACRGRLPLHEGQSFDYERPLEIEAEYHLSVLLAEEADPPRLLLKGECKTPAGELCLRMETLLRLVSPVVELSA
jgi:hypothetical protein